MEKVENPFYLKSYESHKNHKNDNIEKLGTWARFDTIDAWRHKRMYDTVLPLIKSYPHSRWLTIGDGRYGTDANFLIRNNINDVLATSISDELLKQAEGAGFIHKYRVENAEALSFKDNSFDFVMCKESYHHFPRPMIAFYEMLRVADKGIVIIEPNDVNIKLSKEAKTLIRSQSKVQLLKNFIKDFLGIKRYVYNSYSPAGYEVVGNYIYTTSEREFEKAALGINLPVIAFKGLNDIYYEGVEFQTSTDDSPLFKKLKAEISALDADCEKNNKPYNILVSVIFKSTPDGNTLNELENSGFCVNRLPRNPYV